MEDRHDAELRIALAEGIVAGGEAEALAAEARRLGRMPLDLLHERGRISAETIASLKRRPPEVIAPDPDATATVAPARPLPGDGSPALPLRGWDRYSIVRFLGQGGMGQVFLAQDPRLHREVAIKLVRGDAPDAIPRLVAEARAQARVSHERVCKVYEVGEVSAEVYIAMQYIDGETLGALGPTLTVEQAAMVVREAALGVHEAHRAGILHRDLKPSNIMVERGEDGALRPYVMDFGLARSLGAEGSTETGSVLGTPYYMAPEQARGEVHRLDRRADVYSLGASLYHVLTGEPPIPGENGLEVLNNIGAVEPRAPRAVNPDIPVDLEAVLLQCLEKDRSARYDSARALAEDLDRFLNGEPVAARRAGVLYRLRKRLQKHRRLAAAGALAAMVSAAALGFGIKARSDAAARERLARRFTEQVEHIEATARYSALSRLHDIRGDQREMRARMDDLSAEIARGGAAAVGPGNYALGRGYLALGDDANARVSLERAWQSGFHEPRAAYALALVMGHLYQEKLREAERIEDKDQRGAKKREIEGQYRDPALEYLRQSEGAAVPSRAYVSALVAFYEGRLDEALGELAKIGEGLPWFYEAPALRGEILVERAMSRWNHGDKQGARADFDAGREAFKAAIGVAESAPAVHEAMGELEYSEMYMGLYGDGEVMPHFERGLEAVQRAERASPEDYPSRLFEARFYRRLAEYQGNRGADVVAVLAKAVAAAEGAAALAPSQRRAEAQVELGRCHWQWGNHRQDRNQDPGEELRRAIQIFEGVGEKDAALYAHLGLAFKVWADYEDQTGADAMANRGKAIDAFREATRRDPSAADAWMNLGTSYLARASNRRNKDPEGDLHAAAEALDRQRAENPGHIVPYFYGGQIHTLLAQRVRARGGDDRPELGAALDLYQKGSAVNPGSPHLHNGAGTALLEQAKAAWNHGEAPDALLHRAQAAFEQAVASAPRQVYGHGNIGEAHVQRAAIQRARGEDPSESVSAAVTALQRAIDLAPDQVSPWVHLGRAYSLLAAFELSEGRDPREAVALAKEMLIAALLRNPERAEAHAYLGEARATWALWRAKQGGGRAEDFDEAAEGFEEALSRAPEDQEIRLGFGHLCRAWGAWAREAGRDPAPPLSRGLALVNPLLAARPAWPDARLLRGDLLLTQAEATTRPEGRRALAAQALGDLSGALSGNRALERAWKSRAMRAAQIADKAP